MLAPDLEYTGGSVADSIASPPVVGGSPTEVDNSNDIVEMEARQMGMRAAASDRIFSYAHLVCWIWNSRHSAVFLDVRAK